MRPEGRRPAIFLAAWFPAGMGEFPTPFTFGDYLKQDWGLDVRTDMRLLQGTADPVNPGSDEKPVSNAGSAGGVRVVRERLTMSEYGSGVDPTAGGTVTGTSSPNGSGVLSVT